MPAMPADLRPRCSVCAQPLLLVIAGRTVCEVRDDDHATARAQQAGVA